MLGFTVNLTLLNLVWRVSVRSYPYQGGLWAFLCGTVFTTNANWCGRSQPTVRSMASWDGPELCKHGKQWVEQVNMYSFRLSVLLIVSVISCSSSCLDFPATRTIIWKCQLNTLYLSKIATHWVCHHSHRNESRILFQDIAEFCVFM